MAPGFDEGWSPYVPVAERRKQAAREIEKLRKKGHPVAPVILEGRTIARTFWGKAWCDNLESYRDFDNRLPRGRTYVRHGAVIDLQISALEIKAMVSGSSIYRVSVSITALAPTLWRSICTDCAGGIDSLVELLQGRFSKGVMERICRQDRGLFPKPSDIRFSCTCPDGASMCKHVAAVLYGVGARLDERPELLFRLRAVDEQDLVADLDTALSISSRPLDAGKVLETDDISALFGLDMAEAGDAIPAMVPCQLPPSQWPELDRSGPAQRRWDARQSFGPVRHPLLQKRTRTPHRRQGRSVKPARLARRPIPLSRSRKLGPSTIPRFKRRPGESEIPRP